MNRLYLASSLAAMAIGLFAPAARADEWNKKTILTVNQPIAVPGKVLEPGKYVIKLMESPADRHIVQIFNGDESQIITTVIAIPNYRLQPTDKSEFSFWEMPADQPRAIRSWFYPGDNYGQEFAYPKNTAQSIAQNNKTTVPAVTSGEENPQTAKVEPVSPQEEQTTQTAQNNANTETSNSQATGMSTDQSSTAANSAQAPPPPSSQYPESTQSSQTTTATTSNSAANTQANNRLPSTASPYPLMALAGLLALGAGLGARLLARRHA